MILILNEELSLETVQHVTSNFYNDIMVCKDIHQIDRYYTVVCVKERLTIERILYMLTEENRLIRKDADFVCMSTYDNGLALVFRHRDERKLRNFQQIETLSFEKAVAMALSLSEKCIGSQLPPEMLFLALDSENVNLSPSGEIYFNYYLDFAALPQDVTLERTVQKAASLLRGIFKTFYGSKIHKEKKLPSGVRLLNKKQENFQYKTFPELHASIAYIAEELQNQQKGLKGFFRKLSGKFNFSMDRLKLVLVLLVLLIAGFYVYNELKIRSIPAALFSSPEEHRYTGADQMGKLDLLVDLPISDTENPISAIPVGGKP